MDLALSEPLELPESEEESLSEYSGRILDVDFCFLNMCGLRTSIGCIPGCIMGNGPASGKAPGIFMGLPCWLGLGNC